ncbi:MAG: AAA family ATPase, partial [Planctomycetes bacterium]|nr:AAA family ATPase [Planctomycetota bacterium]
IKNLGPLRQAEFSLGDLTILCGGNNTGKTYATYALFGFLSFWREVFSIHIAESAVNQLLAEGAAHIDVTQYVNSAAEILRAGCQAYAKQLPRVFAAQPDRFKDTEFEVTLDPKDIRPAEKFDQVMRAANAKLFSITKSEGSTDVVITLLVEKTELKIPRDIITRIIGNALKDIIFGHLFPNPFIASAERTGAAIFRKELNFPRNRMLEEMSQADKKINPMELLFKVYEDYALPVKTNVEFTRQLETIAKRTSFIAEKHPDVLTGFADIIGGEYAVTRNNELFYVPKGKRIKLSMDESSSAVRSLLDIGFYLRHVATAGDLLMVDEPELNLHPENQRRVARLFARLVNLGIKVFITTHSDYIIKELNTLIMLNHDKPHLKRIAEKEGYGKEELLSSDRVKVYIAEEALVKLDGGQRKTRCQTLTPADIHPEFGIEARSFDTTIETMNRIQEEIVWGGE